MNVSKSGHFKTLQTVAGPLGTVSLGKFMQGGRVVRWSVNLRYEGKLGPIKRPWRFQAENAARTFFARLQTGDVSALVRKWETPTDCETEAQQIIDNPTQKHTPLCRFALLAALDKILCRSKSRDRLLLRDGQAQVLQDLNLIPSDPIAFETWLSEALKLITTVNLKGNWPLGESTIRDKISIFKRILSRAPEFSIAFGSEYSAAMAIIAGRCRTRLDQVIPEAPAKTHFAPFATKEIEDVLNRAPTLSLKLNVIKLLTIGVRRNEKDALVRENVIDGKVQLSRIVRKVKGVKQTPRAPLALRLVLRVSLGVSPWEDAWLDANIPLRYRRFRTTTAVHLVFATKDPLLAMERLGHKTLRMVQENYVTMRPSDAENSTTPQDYYGVTPVTIEGIAVGLGENPYDNWLLFQALNVIKRFGKPEELELAKRITLEEYDKEKYRIERPMLAVASF